MDMTEADLLPLSALQHLLFCERQCALIHLEGVWSENRLTVEGRLMHERVHDGENETREGVRIVRGLRVRSLRLGLTGVADVVEFHPSEGGRWRPYPVEYKRGKPKTDACDEVQLCAQAMCLEEMLGVDVPDGALFYGSNRRRHAVAFDGNLRAVVERASARLRDIVEGGITPPATYEKKCDNCSLSAVCLPRVAACHKSAEAYIRSAS